MTKLKWLVRVSMPWWSLRALRSAWREKHTEGVGSVKLENNGGREGVDEGANRVGDAVDG